MERFAYLIGNLLLAPIVIFFFWRRPDLRQKMITMGVIVTLIGPPFEIWFIQDYWRPQYALGRPWAIEDVLFGLLAGSGPAVAFQFFFGKTIGPRIQKRDNKRLVFLIGFFLLAMILFNNLLGINSIFASILSYLILAAIIVSLRHDLFLNSIVTGLLAGSFAFAFYSLILPFFPNILAHAWLLFNQPLGVTILGVPLTEVLWAASWGLLGGCFYEFWQGYTVVPLKPS